MCGLYGSALYMNFVYGDIATTTEESSKRKLQKQIFFLSDSQQIRMERNM